jgi:Dyp-type peroxidase family
LSYEGYRALGIDRELIPIDSAFRAGMKKRGPEWLNDDPNISGWRIQFKQETPENVIHGMVMVAVATDTLDAERTKIIAALSPGIHSLGGEEGRQIYDNQNRPIEHFRYVDNLSSPVFLKRAVPDNLAWRTVFPLKLVLERCGTGDGYRYGSYLVFRMLEQNAQKFAELEQSVATQLCLPGPQGHERAGAMLLGRSKDGAPLVPFDSASPNDFDYSSDPNGSACPFTAHIRQVNPRGSSDPSRSTADNQRNERAHLIARRGITYGHRTDHRDPTLPPSQRPDRNIGLLFMCYQSSIVNQFEHLQGEWANRPFHPMVPDGRTAGVDSLIGQGHPLEATLPSSCPMESSKRVTLQGCIALKGGEFFFTPSIGFFQRLPQ